MKKTIIALAIILLTSAMVGAAKSEERKKEWQASIGYSNSSFSRSARKDWHEENIFLSRKINDNTSANFTLVQANRFAASDTSIGGGIGHNFANGAYLNASFYATPNADFLARYALASDGGIKLWDGAGVFGPTVATINLLHKDYASGDSENIDPGFVQYMAKMPFWISGKWINGFSKKPAKRTGGYSLKLDWQASENFRPFAGFSFAPEIDGGVVTNVSTRFAGAIYNLNPDTNVRLDYAGEDRKNSYLRNIYSIGFSRRF
ncbi:MAG: YaiO family outer membrane beta-barrel protein [Rhodospirillaceae bacterium]|nr:YaiO family outer membrane beta-barrel protein [Rhodospirillaceae bacterium]